MRASPTLVAANRSSEFDRVVTLIEAGQGERENGDKSSVLRLGLEQGLNRVAEAGEICSGSSNVLVLQATRLPLQEGESLDARRVALSVGFPEDGVAALGEGAAKSRKYEIRK